MTGTFKTLDHTADTGIECTGDTVEDMFEAAGRGMFSIVIDIKKVTPEREFRIEVKASSYEDLLIEWLRELIYIFSVKHIVCAGFSVNISQAEDMLTLSARCSGEKIDPERHEIYTEIKTVTYHQLTVQQLPAHWLGRVIFDI